MARDNQSGEGSTFGTAAYGGEGWSPRTRTLADELGDVWAPAGIDSEWRTLTSVVLHRPGDELRASDTDPDAIQMLAPVDIARAAQEHRQMSEVFSNAGVTVHEVLPNPPEGKVSPNQMFCADLMFATPEGVILARPASTVRAGEERYVARRLGDLGVPIVRSISGRGTFEGADAMWLDASLAVVGCGHRTNEEGARQIREVLAGQGAQTLIVDLPFGTMHLMGMLRIVDRDLAIAWPRRTPFRLVEQLKRLGYRVAFLPEGDDNDMNRAMNFVTLGPRRVLMNGGYDEYQGFLERLGVDCLTVTARELVKAAGGFGCLTGVLERRRA